MPSANLTMNVRRPSDEACVIEIHGDVTAFAENALTDAYNQASNGNTKAVILDFSDLNYMNSSGIGLLVTMLIRANRQKQQMMAVGLNEHYQQIFQLTRLDEAIGIYGSEAEALEKIK
jgi:anti-sigma B factor antagonist